MPLPKKLPDKYQDIDHTRYDTASTMSRAELVEMAELSYQRGDMDARATWQAFAMEAARAEELTESAKRMDEMLKPHAMPPPGRIMDAPAPYPWQSDSEWLSLRAAFDKAKAAADAVGDYDPEQVELRNVQSDAWDALSEREASIKEDLGEIGVWTEQDERVMAAQRQLEIKAEKVARQFNA